MENRFNIDIAKTEDRNDILKYRRRNYLYKVF